MNLKIDIKNTYEIRLVDGKTGKLKKKIEAHNVVTNLLYNHIMGDFTTAVRAFVVGKGTGQPAITDTRLFTPYWAKTLTNHYPVYRGLPDYVNAYTYETVFTENEANGELTEIGLTPASGSGSTSSAINVDIWTHSLFTDSEDNLMSINKTDTDKLYIKATIYSRILPSEGPFIVVRQVPWDAFIADLNPAQMSTKSAIYGGIVKATLGRGGIRMTNGQSPVPVNYQPVTAACSYCNGTTTNIQPGQPSYSSVQGGYTRLTVPRIEAANQNGATTLQIKSIGILGGEGSGYWDHSAALCMYMPFPNHEIFPPKELEFEKVGDGSTTEFNLGVALLMEDPSMVEVKIDGVIQDPSTYDWNGRDFNLAQAWLNADYDCVDDSLTNIYCTSGSSTCIVPTAVGLRALIPYGMQREMYGTQIGYDFKQAVTISCWKNSYSYGGQSSGLYWSDDKETWNLAQRSNAGSFIKTFAPITARYWKIVWDSAMFMQGWELSDTGSNVFYAMGDPKPQIVFHTAPANESIIKIKAKTEYPLKNSNWLIDQSVLDFKVVRGDS